VNGAPIMQRGWDDEHEGVFFRITSSCFSPSFCYGASALLASCDPDEESASIQTVTESRTRPPSEELFIFQPSA
jgi:hypothetical protein